MQYKALYRKYRPLDFDDLIGQDAIVKTLKNSLKNNKIGHAYLFTGTRGTGKTSVAKMFANIVNCEDLIDGLPCGKCKICNTTKKDDNPDIIEIDAASNNGVDEIREIKNKATFVPVISKYKVYIIDEVHMLSIGAFNALLKTLEEPPSHAIFILATTEPHKIPITIISRCQRFDFKKISIVDIKKRLKYIADKEKISIEDDCINELAILSDGSLRDAIGLLDQVNSFSEGNITLDNLYELTGNVGIPLICNIIEHLLNNNINKLIEIYDNLYEKGANFQKIAETMLEVLTNVLISKNAKKYFNKKDIYYKEEIEKLEKISNREILHNIIIDINVLLDNMSNSSNSSLLFELFLLKTIDLGNKTDKKDDNNNIVSEIDEKKMVVDLKNKDNENIKNDNYLLKHALVNNTIALACKEYKNEIKELFSNIDKYLLDSKTKNIATLLMDCNINAASDDHLLLTYKYESLVIEHDKNINKIEKILNELTKRKYKVVAISEDKWKEVRPKFVELKKNNSKIELMDEKKDDTISCVVEELNDIDKTINEFGLEIIEVEE
ncbi:MAG: DNA polymerase III subunit gamma/tau [Tenericutes bacterium]|nr:DNA polymerase III subunit gamma/tau [Mycoplasmatota bacterium]